MPIIDILSLLAFTRFALAELSIRRPFLLATFGLVWLVASVSGKALIQQCCSAVSSHNSTFGSGLWIVESAALADPVLRAPCGSGLFVFLFFRRVWRVLWLRRRGMASRGSSKFVLGAFPRIFGLLDRGRRIPRSP